MKTHYTTSRNKSIMIPIHNIAGSKPLFVQVREWNGRTKGFKLDPHPRLTKLHKAKYYSPLQKSSKRLPPIVVRRILNTRYFAIIDGNHRVAMSIVNDYTHVPCVIELE